MKTISSAAATLVLLSIAATMITIATVSSNSTVVDQPVEDVETRFRMIEHHLRCMWNIRTSEEEYGFFDNPCRVPYMFIQDRYMGSGRIPYEYVEALNIYYDYNQTVVQFGLCLLAPNRCPDHIMPRFDHWLFGSPENWCD